MARKRSPVKFEAALEELERLVDKLEAGDLSLDDSLKTFERGIELSRDCQRALDEAEQRVRILTERDGETADEPLPRDDT